MVAPVSPLYADFFGVASPVGLTAAAASAAMRCRLSTFHELPYQLATDEPVIGAAVPGLSWTLSPSQRLVELLVMALRPAEGRFPVRQWERVPLLILKAGEDQPGGYVASETSLHLRLEQRLGVRFHPQLSLTLAGGPTGLYSLLLRARTLLHEYGVPGCLLCACDSLLNAQALHRLHTLNRLKTLSNSDGIMPGEAAGCVWLSLQPPSPAGSSLQIEGLGFGNEPSTLLNDVPLRADGMYAAVKAACQEAGCLMSDVDLRLSNAAGESFYFKELSLVLSRVLRQRKEQFPLWLPAESVGDTGASSGLLQLAWLSQAFERGYAPGPRALCFLSGQGSERAVIVARTSRARVQDSMHPGRTLA